MKASRSPGGTRSRAASTKARPHSAGLARASFVSRAEGHQRRAGVQQRLERLLPDADDAVVPAEHLPVGLVRLSIPPGELEVRTLRRQEQDDRVRDGRVGPRELPVVLQQPEGGVVGHRRVRLDVQDTGARRAADEHGPIRLLGARQVHVQPLRRAGRQPQPGAGDEGGGPRRRVAVQPTLERPVDRVGHPRPRSVEEAQPEGEHLRAVLIALDHGEAEVQRDRHRP